MAKGKLVDKRVIKMVRDLLSEDSSLTGKELKQKVEATWTEFDYTIRTYQKLKESSADTLEKIKITRHDEPWSLGAYAQGAFESQYKMSAEDNMAILRVRKMQKRREGTLSQSMSVRQAMWMARLRVTVDQHHAGKKEDEKAWWLWMYSFQYAIRDKMVRLQNGNEVFNSRELDDALAQGHEEFKAAYERDFEKNRKELERFYTSHFLNGETEYKPVKDGEK